MKLDYRNEAKAIGATAIVLAGIVLFFYIMYWVINYGWAMFSGGVNIYFKYGFAIIATLVIHRIIRKKVYNPNGD